MEATTEPKLSEERELDAIANDIATEVPIAGTKKKCKVRYLRAYARRRLTSVFLEEGKDDELSCKCAAIIVLGRMWKIKLFYWLLWRWWFYVKEYNDAQLTEIIACGKKKVPQLAFLVNTMLVTGMRDTMMRMTKEEAERFRRELSSESPTP